MSTTSTPATKPSAKSVRYTPEQKKEVVDYAVKYNTENGRGGQSKAADHFKISQLTVASWLKAAGASPAKAKKAKVAKTAKAPKASKAAKAPKASKKTGAARSSRYSDELKKEVVDFAVAHNAENGRGGQSKAASKFKISPLTVISWLKAAGVKSPSKGAAKVSKALKNVKLPKTPKAVVSGDISGKLNSLLALSKQISKAQSELAQLNAKFLSLKASL